MADDYPDAWKPKYVTRRDDDIDPDDKGEQTLKALKSGALKSGLSNHELGDYAAEHYPAHWLPR